MKKTANNKAGGFTLVEMAIVLVIIGLLLGGILKGQELLNIAKVRAIADRQSSLKSAWFAFIDRYGGMPGDLVYASRHIPGALATPTDINAPGGGNGIVTEEESVEAFQQLTAAGLLRCDHCTGGKGTATPSAANSPVNTYGGVMSIWNDSVYYSFHGATSTDPDDDNKRLTFHTGPRIPSNIMAEVDRKIDDGIANLGDMRFNAYDPVRETDASAAAEPVIKECTEATSEKFGYDGNLLWRSQKRSPPVEGNCGGSVFL